MDFSFTEEQQMLLDTTRRFIAERYGFEFRNNVRDSAEGWSRDTWRQLGELGLLAVAIPEEEGGIGAGPVGAMLVGNAIGEGLLLEPYLASAIVATQAILSLGSPFQREQWLPQLTAGDLVAVVMHDEAGMEEDPMRIGTTATREGEAWRLRGEKALAYHAPIADLLLVSARMPDGELALFAIPADTKGVILQSCVTVDDQRAAALKLDDVRVGADARLGGDATSALQAALDAGLAALCAEAFGAMDRLLNATIEYSRSRKQFGVAIGSFQALQHRMAEMLMHLEQARSMSYLATTQCAHPDTAARHAALSSAKVLMGQAARYIGQQAVQLHGGMGMTDELDVSHYFKRLLAFELRFGTTDVHLARYGRDALSA